MARTRFQFTDPPAGKLQLNKFLIPFFYTSDHLYDLIIIALGPVYYFLCLRS
jgi:hypothetical protein